MSYLYHFHNPVSQRRAHILGIMGYVARRIGFLHPCYVCVTVMRSSVDREMNTIHAHTLYSTHFLLAQSDCLIQQVSCVAIFCPPQSCQFSAVLFDGREHNFQLCNERGGRRSLREERFRGPAPDFDLLAYPTTLDLIWFGSIWRHPNYFFMYCLWLNGLRGFFTPRPFTSPL